MLNSDAEPAQFWPESVKSQGCGDGVPMLKKRSSECCAGPQDPERSSLAGFLVITYGRIGVIPEACIGWPVI